MAAAVDSLTENLQCVNEPLEGHSISYHNRNRAAELAGFQENFECLNAALEKAKKHFFPRVQILDEKIDEQRELSELIMNEVCDGSALVEKGIYKLNYLTKMPGKWEEKFTKFDEDEKERELYVQMAEELLGKTVVEKKQVDKMTRFESVKVDRMTRFESYEKERELYLQMAEDLLGKTAVEKKQVNKMARFESFEKERELYLQMAEDLLGKTVVEKKQKGRKLLQRAQDLMEKMDEVEKKQEEKFTKFDEDEVELLSNDP